jgi:hypothetical protein
MRGFGVCVMALVLAGCSSPPVPPPSAQLPSPGPSQSRSATTSPSPTPGGAGSLTFRLILTATDRISTEGFDLYLDTDPPSLGQTVFVLCRGQGELGAGDPQLCGPSNSYERKFAGFSPDTVLVYRFACTCSTKAIASGSHVADGSLIQATYPPQPATK